MIAVSELAPAQVEETAAGKHKSPAVKAESCASTIEAEARSQSREMTPLQGKAEPTEIRFTGILLGLNVLASSSTKLSDCQIVQNCFLVEINGAGGRIVFARIKRAAALIV